MDEPQIFRRRLAVRILGLLGTTSLASCTGGAKEAGAPPDAGATTSSSSSSASSTSATSATSSTTGSGGAGGAGSGVGGAGGAGGASGPSSVASCFDLSTLPEAGAVDPADGGVCPVDPTVALADFKALGCPLGWEPYRVVSGPMPGDAGDQCCYLVLNVLCAPGGRPYLDGDRACLAPARRGAGDHGWTEGGGPSLDSLAALTAGERAALAAAWTADGLMEHASVASFARFSLALLAAGAPADLVALAHRAALDEVRHARLCFALAAAYAGDAVAPGPFPIGGDVRVDASLAALAVSTVREGCVGETVAAVIAAEQLARATDPAVRAALATIADDEARHAELAWRTVAWAVRTGGDQVYAAVEHALVEAIKMVPGAAASALRAMGAHGRLDAATTARVTASAMAEIVAPAARALLRENASIVPSCLDSFAPSLGAVV